MEVPGHAATAEKNMVAAKTKFGSVPIDFGRRRVRWR